MIRHSLLDQIVIVQRAENGRLDSSCILLLKLFDVAIHFHLFEQNK